jgi:hypothetical protein
MDAFGARRRAKDLPAISLQWGPWAEVGMAARAGTSEGGWNLGFGWLGMVRTGWEIWRFWGEEKMIEHVFWFGFNMVQLLVGVNQLHG